MFTGFINFNTFFPGLVLHSRLQEVVFQVVPDLFGHAFADYD